MRTKVKIKKNSDLFGVGEVVYIKDVYGHNGSIMEITDLTYTDRVHLNQLELSIRNLVQIKLFLTRKKIIRHEN